jgi:hypothetical protein
LRLLQNFKERETHTQGEEDMVREITMPGRMMGEEKKRGAEETWHKHYMCKDVRTPLPSPGGLEAVAATTSSHGSYYSLDLF